MMTRNFLFNNNVILLIVPMFIFSLCASPEKELTLAAENSGQQFELFKNTDITIALEANPTTGYRWTISELDTSILTEIEKVSFDTDSENIGAPGIQTFRFKSIRTGKTRLKLIYQRPWETDKKPLDSYSVFFVVKE